MTAITFLITPIFWTNNTHQINYVNNSLLLSNPLLLQKRYPYFLGLNLPLNCSNSSNRPQIVVVIIRIIKVQAITLAPQIQLATLKLLLSEQKLMLLKRNNSKENKSNSKSSSKNLNNNHHQTIKNKLNEFWSKLPL